jgi:ATP-dependent RNA helicase DDX49/DBP8
MVSFEELGVSRGIVESLNAMNIYSPSAIQEACIPAILKGKTNRLRNEKLHNADS